MDHPTRKNFSRLFCAVALPTEVRARAAAHAVHLRTRLDEDLKVSWEREEKMHVTVKFFGDVLTDRVASLADALSRTARRLAPFELRLARCGVFASLSRPRVLWLGIEDERGRLATLQRDIEDECAREGFPRDARPFHPHVTLARLRFVNEQARRLARLHIESEFAPVGFRVGEIVLVCSELGARGSRYTIHSRHELSEAT